jgi:hypothetical protein
VGMKNLEARSYRFTFPQTIRRNPHSISGELPAFDPQAPARKCKMWAHAHRPNPTI